MDCQGCQQIQYGLFTCQTCLQEEKKKFKAKSTFILHEIKIWSNRIKQQWPKEKHELQSEISRLESSIDSTDTMVRQLPSAILQAKERVNQLRNQNKKRKEVLKPLKEKYRLELGKISSEYLEQQFIFKGKERSLKDSSWKTRLAILANLSLVSQISLSTSNNVLADAKRESTNSHKSIYPRQPQTTSFTKNIENLSQELFSQQTYRRSRQHYVHERENSNPKSLTGRANIAARTKFKGGAGHIIKVTALISRYLDLKIPFDLELRFPKDVNSEKNIGQPCLYLKHDYSEHQDFCKHPLFGLETSESGRDILTAIANYNIIYLQHHQNLLTSPDTVLAKPDAHQKVNHLILGPIGLLKLFQGYQELFSKLNERYNVNKNNKQALFFNHINESEVQKLSSTFTLEFNHVLAKVKTSNIKYGPIDPNSVTTAPVLPHPHHLYDDHFGSSHESKGSLPTNSELDEDYDLDFSLDHPEDIHSSNKFNSDNKQQPDSLPQKEESEDLWESVEVILPPTPSEMTAAGL